MKELSKYKLKKISRNLDFFFNYATDDDIKNGSNWYKKANVEVQRISDVFNIQPYLVAQVISCLSPRNKWEQNLKDAFNVCQAYKIGVGPDAMKVCTFNKNKYKAFNVLNGNISITNNSLKTYNFVHNLLLSKDSVTVDIWHLRACKKTKIGIDSANIGKLAYKQIKQLTVNKAIEVNMLPYQYQAIIWLSVQRYFNNK